MTPFLLISPDDKDIMKITERWANLSGQKGQIQTLDHLTHLISCSHLCQDQVCYVSPTILTLTGLKSNHTTVMLKVSILLCMSWKLEKSSSISKLIMISISLHTELYEY